MKIPTLKPKVPMLRTPRTAPTAGSTPRLSDRSGHAWAKIRKRILERDILCVYCLAATPKRVTPSAEVDHRIPLHQGGTDDDSNLAGTCVPCHRAKTAKERGGA